MANKLTSSVLKTKDKTVPVEAPKKKSMNFAHHQSSVNLKRLIPVAVILVAAILSLFKFGIMNPLNKKLAAQSELASRQDQLTALNLKLTEFDALSDQYGRYSYGWMNDGEKNIVERMDILSLIESKVMPLAVVEDLSINHNVLSMNIHGVTLNQASSIIKDLESSDLVESASIYKAAAEDGSEAAIFMSVVLTKEVDAE